MTDGREVLEKVKNIYDFKNASPDYIREKAKDPDYERFELPYCSRCTRVIVGAVMDVITNAKEKGNLTDSIETKKFICYLPDKLEDSLNYPKIIHAKCSVQRKNAPYISKFIESVIQKIPEEEINRANEKCYPCVLIIGPTHYLRQINEFLINKNYKVTYEEKKKDNKVEDIAGIIGISFIGQKDLLEQLPEEYRYKHEKDMDLLNRLKLNSASIEEQNELKNKIGLDLDEIKNQLPGVKEVSEKDKFQNTDSQEKGQASIKLTTFQGSKGFGSEYELRPSKFVEWIDESKLSIEEVNKTYFN